MGYLFIFVTLQCKIFVVVLKNIYVKLEYTIRKLPKFFCLIFLFFVIVLLKYIKLGDSNFSDILMLRTLKQEVIILVLFLHAFGLKALLMIFSKIPLLIYKWINFYLISKYIKSFREVFLYRCYTSFYLHWSINTY